MSAIYGIVGNAEGSELERMGQRLAHRGSAITEWSPAPTVLFGRRIRDENGSGPSGALGSGGLRWVHRQSLRTGGCSGAPA